MGILSDGSAAGDTPNTNTAAATLTTSMQGIVVAHISLSSSDTVSSVTSSHLTFTQRATHNSSSSRIEVWTAYSSNPLASEVITAVISAASGFTIAVYGFADTTSSGYLDSNASLPTIAGGAFPNNPAITGISSTTGTFALFLLSGVQILTSDPAPTGYTTILTHASSGGFDTYAAYQDYGTTLSSQSVSYSTNPYGGFGWSAAEFVFVGSAPPTGRANLAGAGSFTATAVQTIVGVTRQGSSNLVGAGLFIANATQFVGPASGNFVAAGQLVVDGEILTPSHGGDALFVGAGAFVADAARVPSIPTQQFGFATLAGAGQFVANVINTTPTQQTGFANLGGTGRFVAIGQVGAPAPTAAIDSAVSIITG